MMLLFLRGVWVWVKAHWKLILVGVLTLGVGLLVGKTLKKAPVVVNPELTGAEDEQRKAQAREDAARAQAERDRFDALVKIEQEHARTIKNLTDEQKEQVKELRENPDRLNEYLLNVGKEVRGS